LNSLNYFLQNENKQSQKNNNSPTLLHKHKLTKAAKSNSIDAKINKIIHQIRWTVTINSMK